MGRTIEYALVAVIIAVGVIYGASVLSKSIAGSFAKTTKCIEDPKTCKR